MATWLRVTYSSNTTLDTVKQNYIIKEDKRENGKLYFHIYDKRISETKGLSVCTYVLNRNGTVNTGSQSPTLDADNFTINYPYGDVTYYGYVFESSFDDGISTDGTFKFSSVFGSYNGVFYGTAYNSSKELRDNWVYNDYNIFNTKLAFGNINPISKLSDDYIKKVSSEVFKSNISSTTQYAYIGTNTPAFKEDVIQYTITQNLENVTSDYTETKANENSEITINLNKTDGYIWSDTPTLTINDTVTEFNHNTDNDTYSLTFTLTDNAVISANAIVKPVVKYSITQNLTNCKSNRDIKEADENTQLYFSITSNDGYVFYDTPTYTINGVTDTFIDISGDKTQYGKTITITGDLTINANAELPTVKYRITQNLTGVTSDYTNKQADENTEITITLTKSSDNYEWNSAPTLTINEISTNFNHNADNDTYSLTFTLTGNAVISANASLKQYLVSQSITNATFNYNVGYVDAGTVLNFEIAPNTGFKFNTLPYVTDGENITYFTENDTGVYTLAYTVNNNVTVVAHAVDDTTAESIQGYVNYYVVSKEALETLANERILRVVDFHGGSSSTVNVQYVDTGEFILLILALYIPVTGVNTDLINYGGYISKAVGQLPENNVITIDCGTVKIDEKYHSIQDYSRYTDIVFNLPFIGVVSVDTDLFMDSNINVTYIANILNGNITCNITNTDTGYTLTFTGNCGYNVPIKYNNRLGENQFISLNQSVISSDILNTDTPVITITSDKAEDNNMKIGKTDKTDIGENLKGGYIECDNVNLHVSEFETETEQNEIYDLFRNGVYINE